jgi:hypothetical protein
LPWAIGISACIQGRSGIALLVLAALCLAPAGDSEGGLAMAFRFRAALTTQQRRLLWTRKYVDVYIHMYIYIIWYV